MCVYMQRHGHDPSLVYRSLPVLITEYYPVRAQLKADRNWAPAGPLRQLLQQHLRELAHLDRGRDQEAFPNMAIGNMVVGQDFNQPNV